MPAAHSLKVAKLLFKSIALLLISVVTLAAEPKPFTAKYHIERDGDVIGEASISLHPMGGGKWRYITESKASIFLFSVSDSETSIVQFNGDEVIPLSMIREQNKPTRASRTEQIFDWPNKTETGKKDEKKQWKLLLVDGVQERHSQGLVMRNDLRKGAKSMSYKISETGKLREYKYVVGDKEQLETPAGKYNVVKVERDRDDSSRQTISWHAQELDFIPVKVRQIEDGKIQADMVLTAIEI